MTWSQAAGGNARVTPLNTTTEAAGATNYYPVGVKNYISSYEGVTATAMTLEYGARNNLYGYKPISDGFAANKWASKILWAVERSQWGTGGLALRCLSGVKRDWDTYRVMPISS